MTDREIRIMGAQYLVDGKAPTTPQAIAAAIGVPTEAFAKAFKKLHLCMTVSNRIPNPQDTNYVYVLPDGNSHIPASYSMNGRTQKFLDNPF